MRRGSRNGRSSDIVSGWPALFIFNPDWGWPRILSRGLIAAANSGATRGLQRMPIQKTVFISYRREDGGWARCIWQSLVNRGYDVFLDLPSLPSGDFEAKIFENIETRAHFIVLLTPTAIERCSEDKDLYRLEIERALDTNRNIVPVIVKAFDYRHPNIAQHLTGKLVSLKNKNSVTLSDEYFDDGTIPKILRFLNVSVDPEPHTASAVAVEFAHLRDTEVTSEPPVPEAALDALGWFQKGFATDDVDERLRCFNESLRLNPRDSNSYNNRGIARFSKGDIRGAIIDYDHAIRLKPDNPAVHYNRGNALLHQERWSEAESDFSAVISTEPDNHRALTNRGGAREGTGDLEGAKKDYQEANRLAPGAAHGHYNLGRVLAHEGDADGAIKAYDEAIRLAPGDPDAYVGRGFAYASKSNWGGAVSDYSQAIHLNPGLADIYGERGIAHCRKNDFKAGLKDFDEAIRLKPVDARIYNNRGITHRLLGNLDGALKDHDAAIKLDPNLAGAYYSRGNARKLMSDLKGAQEDFDTAARLRQEPTTG